MAFYNKEKRGGYGAPKKFGDRGNFEKRRDGFDRGDRGGFGGRNSGRGQMFDATCSQCGNECQVPFRPNGRKPVLCSNCFGKQKSFGDRPQRSFDRPRFSDRSERPAPQENLKEQFDKLSNKLDRIIDLLMENNARAPQAMDIMGDDDDFVPAKPKKAKKTPKAKKKKLTLPKKSP